MLEVKWDSLARCVQRKSDLKWQHLKASGVTFSFRSMVNTTCDSSREPNAVSAIVVADLPLQITSMFKNECLLFLTEEDKSKLLL